MYKYLIIKCRLPRRARQNKVSQKNLSKRHLYTARRCVERSTSAADEISRVGYRAALFLKENKKIMMASKVWKVSTADCNAIRCRKSPSWWFRTKDIYTVYDSEAASEGTDAIFSQVVQPHVPMIKFRKGGINHAGNLDKMGTHNARQYRWKKKKNVPPILISVFICCSSCGHDGRSICEIVRTVSDAAERG